MKEGMSRRTFVKLAGAGAAALAVGDAGLSPESAAALPSAGVQSVPAAQMPPLDPQMQMVIDQLKAHEPPPAQI